MTTLIDRLSNGEFEHPSSPFKDLYYRWERAVGNAFFKRPPPEVEGEALLNLGCGPLRYEGFINADDYGFKRALRQSDFVPDWRLDITTDWNCPNAHWDGIFTQHVLEHLHYSDCVRTLRECLRTLKPGAWLRISVPSVQRYVENYLGESSDPYFEQFPHGTLGFCFLAQMHGHLSTWDAPLMVAVLRELGFADARECDFGQGLDQRLVVEQENKAPESLYVEARRPA